LYGVTLEDPQQGGKERIVEKKHLYMTGKNHNRRRGLGGGILGYSP